MVFESDAYDPKASESRDSAWIHMQRGFRSLFRDEVRLCSGRLDWEEPLLGGWGGRPDFGHSADGCVERKMRAHDCPGR